MELSRIKEFAEKWGFDDVKFLVEWRGYDVYDGIFAPERKDAVSVSLFSSLSRMMKFA